MKSEKWELRTMVKIGEEIPDFEAEVYQDFEIKKVKLSDFRGQWLILAFYPRDFTFVCPTELEDLAEKYEEFKKIGGEIISVSTDSAFVHLAWHNDSPSIGKVNYPMMADPTGKVCRAFGTMIEEEGKSLRATFIIDPEGILKAMDIHDNSIGRTSREILRKLQAAIHVRENPGAVCPAKWEPGDETLTESLDLVGKI
jgi:peroxiredoxin (alkyl hydroperoxide reductase subunit C)